jgi:hypothetical protein
VVTCSYVIATQSKDHAVDNVIISHNQDTVLGYPCNSVEVMAFCFIISFEM